MRSRSNREDGSSHISHPGKDAAVYDSKLRLKANTSISMTGCITLTALYLNFAVNKT